MNRNFFGNFLYLLGLLSLVTIAKGDDYSFGRKDFKEGVHYVKGIEEGKYYIQCELSEDGTKNILCHKGKVVNLVRGAPWIERNGRNFMLAEADMLDIKNGDAFTLGENPRIQKIIFSKKPLTYAPQKLFTPIYTVVEPYSFKIEWGENDFTITVKNCCRTPIKGDVSISMTDYWQRETASFKEKSVEIAEKKTFKIPYKDTLTGYCIVRVNIDDEEGNKADFFFTRLTDSKTAFRETISLNSSWERAFVKDDGTIATRKLNKNPPDGTTWKKVSLPAEILGSLTWLRTKKVLPESFAGKKVFFKMNRLVGDAELYIDGEKAAEIGREFNHNGKQEFDITQYIKPGKEHSFLLASRHADFAVLPEAELAKKIPDRSKSFAMVNIKSAIAEIFLEARPTVSIGNVKVATSFRDKTISVDTACPEGYSIKNSVWYKDEKKLEFEKSAKWNNPILWGPFDFPLLRLETSLVDTKGNVVDVKETRFGFREFWGEGMKLMWNGNVVRGDARAFTSSWGWDFDRRSKRQQNINTLRVVKKRGVKFLRHIYNVDEFIDYCDELGIPVAKGGMSPSGPSLEKSANDAWWKVKEDNDRWMIESLYNHPSIMTWYLSNEYYGQSEDVHWKRISSAVKNAIALDPTRFAEGGCDIDVRKTSNVISTHYPVEGSALREAGTFMPYCFYWRPVDKKFEKGMKVPFGQIKRVCNVFEETPITWGEKPICINETCWDSFFSVPFGYTRIGGEDVFNQVEFTEKWHIRTNKEAVRGHRDAEVSLWTPWRWYTVDPISYVSPEIDIVPIQRYSHFYTGEKVSYDVNAFYDVWKKDVLTWFWQIEDFSGRVVLKGSKKKINAGTSELLREKVSFVAPNPGRYVVRCGFKDKKETSWTIDVSAKVKFDFPPNVIRAEDELSSNLLARAKSGETIVILARENYPQWLPEIASLSEQSAAILRSFRKSHPILKGLKDKDITYFYPSSIACKKAFVKPAAGNARSIIEFGGPSGFSYSALLEVPYGKGAFLYSRLVLEPEINPVAVKLIDNMASYVRRGELGKGLYIAGGNAELLKALRVRCNIELDEGPISKAKSYNAVFLDGSITLSDGDIKALEKYGKTVFVFSPNPQFNMPRTLVKAKSWKGRAVKTLADELTEGLTNQDMMWRTKYTEWKTAVSDLGKEEFVFKEGALLYPAYLARRGNFVFVSADPSSYHVVVAQNQKRFWSILFGNAGVKIKPFEKPSLPKNLFYDTVDISNHLKYTLDDDVEGDGKGSWNDQGKSRSLVAKFKYPIAWVGRIPFDFKQKGPCAFALSTEYRKGGESNVVININRKINTLSFLYASAWTQKNRRHIRIHLKYEDGSSYAVDGVGGVNMHDWVSEKPDFSEEIDTVSSFTSFSTGNPLFKKNILSSMTVINPAPEKKVKEVVFERGVRRCARVGVFAVTIGSKECEYSSLSLSEKQKLHDKFTEEGRKEQKAKNYIKAIEIFEKAIRVMPEKVWVYRSIGEIYEAMHDWQHALLIYQRSLEADFNQPDLWESEKRMKNRLGIK